MVVLVGCFSCTPDDTSGRVFLLVTHFMLVLMRFLSYTPHTNFSEVFLLHT